MTIVSFDLTRCRPATAPPPGLKSLTGAAEVLMFTGVRRERLTPTPAPHHPKPMLSDPAPGKPGASKRRR